MKLRNKKTGEIVEICKICPEPFEARDFACNSLAELNEVWEDYKEQYYIDCDGRIFDNHTTDYIKVKMQEIGNYFETREEAEQAVEKLKAWKRLTDKGFKSYSSNICGDDFVVNFKLTNHVDYGQSMDDFDCIFDFGGEE